MFDLTTQGRATRKEYFAEYTLVILARYLIGLLIRHGIIYAGRTTILVLWAVLYGVLVPVRIRRAHDFNFPWWWAVMDVFCLIGFVIVFVLIARCEPNYIAPEVIWFGLFTPPVLVIAAVNLSLMFVSGSKGANKYGPDPRGGINATRVNALSDNDDRQQVADLEPVTGDALAQSSGETNELLRTIREITSELIPLPDCAYLMSRTVVTKGQWRMIMEGSVGRRFGDELPMDTVSWFKSKEFIDKLNNLPEMAIEGYVFRLPTEVEWEFAARAGSMGEWGCVEDGVEGRGIVMGWFQPYGGDQPHSARQKAPNLWGLYDMHGNVWEWCSDGDDAGHIAKGGCYNSTMRECTCGYSRKFANGYSIATGLRLVAERIG